MIILNQQQRLFLVGHLFEHGIGELLVDGAIRLPIGRTKNWTRVRNVTKWPEAFVRKSEVITFLFILGEPNSSQSVFRIIGRNPQLIIGINRFLVRVATPMSNPFPITCTEN